MQFGQIQFGPIQFNDAIDLVAVPGCRANYAQLIDDPIDVEIIVNDSQSPLGSGRLSLASKTGHLLSQNWLVC